MADAAAKTNAKPARTAITPTRAENFPEWYQQVIKAADMAESSAVRGCMIIKPYGFAVWENAQKHLGQMIKDEDVQNAYFPLLIPLSYIAKEAEHVEGFAKECAIVTHHRLSADGKGGLVPDPESALTEPMIIRPTSETIIGESMHNWVQSYRDLPLKLNQWCNVMRWEMRPRIFLRTAEFLWQEGHNAFATAEEADADARKMLNVYRTFFEDYMAIPGIVGVKTPEERFPGAIETYTIEAFMQDGKALQGCTSHNLGQTFAKSSDIKFLDKDGVQKLAWTTSWGLTTRTIGAMIMVHGDDDGMIMPPRMAPHQVVILPFLKDDADTPKIMEACEEMRKSLLKAGISVQIDKTEERSSDKMWTAIKKGVPVRLEIGARELAEGKISFTRRDLGKDGKQVVTIADAPKMVAEALDKMHGDMLERARAKLKTQIHDVSSLADLHAFFKAEKQGGVKIDYALVKGSEEYEKIAKEFSLSTRCLPFDAADKVIIAKAY